MHAMLDTKILKLSPSSSVERPMSPLAVRKADEGITTRASQGYDCNFKNPTDIYVNRNKEDDQDLSHSQDDEGK